MGHCERMLAQRSRPITRWPRNSRLSSRAAATTSAVSRRSSSDSSGSPLGWLCARCKADTAPPLTLTSADGTPASNAAGAPVTRRAHRFLATPRRHAPCAASCNARVRTVCGTVGGLRGGGVTPRKWRERALRYTRHAARLWRGVSDDAPRAIRVRGRAGVESRRRPQQRRAHRRCFRRRC